ncbi:MAG: hypothetical protein RL198_578 [Actinomycetota bacterium]
MNESAVPNPLNLDQGLVELTRDLVDRESVSGNEAELTSAIESSLGQLPWLRVVRNGDAVVASTNLGCAQRVILAGHLDTVPVANNLPSRLIHLEREQVIWGRGSVDMKAGVAVMLKLATELSRPRYDLTWIFYDNEEVDSSKNGMGRIAAQQPELLKGDFAVLLEPTAGFIEGGCNGTLRAEIRVRGKKAHSARPWMGQNAIHSAAEVLNRLSEYEPRIVEVAGLEYRESMNAVRFEAGIANNVIPDLAVVTVNHRFAPDRTEIEAAAEVERLFAGFEVQVVDSAPAAFPGLDMAIAEGLLSRVEYPPRAKHGWTDVARFSQLGIPAVNFGPGDPNLAHSDDENVPVGQIMSVYAALGAWLSAS